MITTTYNYSSGTGFVYDATKIGFVSSMAQLLLVDNLAQTFSPSISASTYDTAVLEYVGGALRQKDLRPATATFYASWSSMLNGNWGNGNLTVTPFNGAAISGGALDLTGATNKYVTFSGTSNADSAQVGSIEIQFIPNYNGSPATQQVIFDLTSAQGSLDNIIDLQHGSDGNLIYQVFDSTGTLAFRLQSAFVAVSGTTYTILLQYDGTAGANKIFVNGSQLGSTDTTTFTRTNVEAFIICGLDFTGIGPGNANFSLKNLAFYSSIVTPSTSILAPSVYAAAVAELPLFTYAGIGDVQVFTGFSGTDSGSPRYTLNGKYWTGSVWSASNGTYAQANDKSSVNTNIATLPASDTLQVNVYYIAQNSPQQGISSLLVTYTGQIYPTSDPSIATNAALSMDQLSDFSAVLAASGSDGVQFYINSSSIKYWWDGAAWSVSNGTYAQSNTAAVINTNAATLPFTLGAFVTPYALLHSATGATTPMLTSLTLTYDFFGPEPTPPATCLVFGYILDEKEIPIVGATISVTNPTTFVNSGIIIAQGVRTTTTDSLGYFSINLVETASMATPALLTFQVTYSQTQVGTGFTPTTFVFGASEIPNVPEANIATFTFI